MYNSTSILVTIEYNFDEYVILFNVIESFIGHFTLANCVCINMSSFFKIVFNSYCRNWSIIIISSYFQISYFINKGMKWKEVDIFLQTDSYANTWIWTTKQLPIWLLNILDLCTTYHKILPCDGKNMIQMDRKYEEKKVMIWQWRNSKQV